MKNELTSLFRMLTSLWAEQVVRKEKPVKLMVYPFAVRDYMWGICEPLLLFQCNAVRAFQAET
jgi:hypothetical protein